MPRTFFCPRCLDSITPEQVQYRTREGEAAARPRIAYDRTPRDWARAIWDGDPGAIHKVNPRTVAQLHATGVHAQCPKGHRLPDKAFDIPSVIIGLVGEPSAGKTVFLGTLLEQLDRGRLLPYLDFTLDERSEALRDEIFHDFYVAGRVPETTLPNQGEAGREAIMATARSGALDAFYLWFFDTSGEQNRLIDHGRYNQFLFVADVVMFFITPEALSLKRRYAGRRGDQRQAWYTTNGSIQAAVRAGTRPKAHAAIIVIKSDDIDPSELDILTDARGDLDYGDGLTLHRAWEVITQDSGYIREFLRSSEDGRTLSGRIEKAYGSTSYHLVSATGEPAEPAENRFVRRRPQRVLDPLLAALVHARMLDPHDGRRGVR